MFPSISNPLQGGAKKLRIITTPNGQGNFFHRLWQDASAFSKHRVTVHDAITDGLPLDLSQLRHGLFDPDAWAQEYECEFLDGSTVLLPYELIESCESDEAIESSSPQILSSHPGELFAGIDFGRKNDLTVCWILERLMGGAGVSPAAARVSRAAVFLTREVLILDRLSTPAQFELLHPRLSRVRRACIDYTGAGVGLGDLLAREFGEFSPSPHGVGRGSGRGAGKMELCQFSASLKQELFPTLRAAFEQGRLLIPRSHAIREDLHGVQKFVSAAGQISYRASHTPDGHSDRCTALALALRAADSLPPLSCARSIEIEQRSF